MLIRASRFSRTSPPANGQDFTQCHWSNWTGVPIHKGNPKTTASAPLVHLFRETGAVSLAHHLCYKTVKQKIAVLEKKMHEHTTKKSCYNIKNTYERIKSS